MDSVGRVFLCHNSLDKEFVKSLALVLLRSGALRTWLDTWEIIGGKDWEEHVQREFFKSWACLVIVGENGLGPYQRQEIEWAKARNAADSSYLLIPVLLPNADSSALTILEEILPRIHWVQFNHLQPDTDSAEPILKALRGQRPGPPAFAIRIAVSAEEWETSGRLDRSAFLRGHKLRSAKRLLTDPNVCDELSVAFISACDAAQGQRRRNAVGVLGLVVVLFSIGAAWWDSLQWAKSNGYPSEYARYKFLWQLAIQRQIPDWVEINPGTFVMGCKKGRDDIDGYWCDADDSPHHTVRLTHKFALSKRPITRLQYAYYLWDSGIKPTASRVNDWLPADAPMRVTWQEAKTYAIWLNKKIGSAKKTIRLPTEAEWEYSARAGSDLSYWIGDSLGLIMPGCSGGKPGTYDVSEVREWVEDVFEPYDPQDKVDPVVTRSDLTLVERVVRNFQKGGGDNGDDPNGCRAASRIGYEPGTFGASIGFRVSRGNPIEEKSPD